MSRILVGLVQLTLAFELLSISAQSRTRARRGCLQAARDILTWCAPPHRTQPGVLRDIMLRGSHSFSGYQSWEVASLEYCLGELKSGLSLNGNETTSPRHIAYFWIGVFATLWFLVVFLICFYWGEVSHYYSLLSLGRRVCV